MRQPNPDKHIYAPRYRICIVNQHGIVGTLRPASAGSKFYTMFFAKVRTAQRLANKLAFATQAEHCAALFDLETGCVQAVSASAKKKAMEEAGCRSEEAGYRPTDGDSVGGASFEVISEIGKKETAKTEKHNSHQPDNTKEQEKKK